MTASLNVFHRYVRPLIRQLGGIYYADYKKASCNLENTKEDNLRYLGTYFPRTALESHVIFHHLFRQMHFLGREISGKECISVLDFGCGTAGELVGLLSALQRAFGEKAPAVRICALDGNDDALGLAKRVIDLFREESGMEIVVDFLVGVVRQKSFLCDRIQKHGPFDIIVTSKFLNEVNDMFSHPYYHFAESLMPSLTQNGIAVLMDVTCRQSEARGGEWSGKQLYKELKCFRQHNPQYRMLFPMICDNASCRKCHPDCFPQFVFDFAEMGMTGQSKLAYSVLCRDELWQKERARILPADYCLSKTPSKQIVCREARSEGRTAELPECCINNPRQDAIIQDAII